MSRPKPSIHRRFIAATLLALAFATPNGARAGSTRAIAAIGDAAPGGGLFAGPGFGGWPSAAGDSWIAFRSQLTGGSATATLVVAHVKTPAVRATVATIGGQSPGVGELAGCAGSFKEFVGRPIVNRWGEVAFVALIQPAQDADDDAFAPLPAGIFLYRGSTLSAVACSGQRTPQGRIDLLAVGDASTDATGAADRSPAFNDNGQVAFLAGLVGNDGPNGAAIFRVPLGGAREQVIGTGNRLEGGVFVAVGPPALNNAGLIAFRGQVTDTEDTTYDGIFTVAARTASLLVRGGFTISPLETPLTDIEEPVSLNDAGDVAFLAGPIRGNEDVADSDAPAVFVSSGGIISLLTYPGEQFGPVARVVSVAIGSSGNAPPMIAPDGTVVFFMRRTDGEAIVRWNGSSVEQLLLTAGNAADATPAGGTYGGLQSAPAIDGMGGVVFIARIVAGSVSQAIVYQALDGPASSIIVGEGSPGTGGLGFFAGDPFSAPALNDSGEVVFRAYLAQTTASVGIFRYRDGRLESVVRSGDVTPEGAVIIDLPGEPRVNHRGSIAFAAVIRGACADEACPDRRGIYIAADERLRTIAVNGDPAPAPPTENAGVWNGLSANVAINDESTVAFHGFTVHRDDTGAVKREGIFLVDGNGPRILLYGDDPSPAGGPFLDLRDPFVTDIPSAIYRGTVGEEATPRDGLFVSRDGTPARTVAMIGQYFGSGLVVTGLTGNPSVSAGGSVAFGATRARISPRDPAVLEPLGPAILKHSAGDLSVVVARDMAGPVGGTFRGFGAPGISGLGHIAFRGSFTAGLGGVPGLFFHDGDQLRSHVLRGDLTPIGGRFASFGARTTINGSDEVVFAATVTGGRARSGIFLASPTTVTSRSLRFRLTRGRGRDRIRLQAALLPGLGSDGIDPTHEPVVLTLMDGKGTVWSVTVPGRTFRSLRQGGFVAVPSRKTTVGKALRTLRLKPTRDGKIRLRANSAPVDLSDGGARELQPPFALNVQVGADAGAVRLVCVIDRRGGRCRS